jgi:hypothetical protein
LGKPPRARRERLKRAQVAADRTILERQHLKQREAQEAALAAGLRHFSSTSLRLPHSISKLRTVESDRGISGTTAMAVAAMSAGSPQQLRLLPPCPRRQSAWHCS